MKTFRIRMTIEFDRDYPDEDYVDIGHVDFHLNGSSWCIDNVIDDLEEYADKLEKAGSCLCPNASFEVIEMRKRDAVS